MTPAGRPREFDLDVALDAAMEAFWLRGYESTSMADLVEATGVQKGSLYKAFGDKHALFLKALERYLERMLEEMAPCIIEAPTAAEAIRCWIRYSQVTGVTEHGRKGCMAANTVTELAQHDPKVRAVMQEHMKRVMAATTGVVRRGQEAGEFRSDVDAESLAEYLMTVSVGIVTKGKADFPAHGKSDLADVVLAALEPR